MAMSDWLDAEAHADRALEWFERGRWAEAEAELRKAISLNPDQAEWHFNLALTLEAAGREPEALASYEHAIDLMPTQVEPLVAAGSLSNRLGQFRRALERFDQALRLEPACEPAYARKMESHLRLGEHDDVQTTFYLAQHSLSDPSAECLAVMAESLIQQGEHGRAEWCLKEALRLDAGMPRLRARLAAVLAATGRSQRALQLYLRELRDDPGNIETLLDYGELLMELGRLPDAAEKFRRVLELEPANVDAHCHLGQVAMHGHRYEQAHLEFELVCSLDPDYPEIRLDLASALMHRGRVLEARRILQDELDQLRAREEGRAARSAVDREGAGEEGPGPAALRRFGELLLTADMSAPAAVLLERAVDVSDRSADLLRSLALAHFQAGHRDRGVAASRRVLRLDRRCVRSIHNLALAALETGQLRMAAGWIARGLNVDRHDVGLRRLRMRLCGALFAARLKRVLGRATRRPSE
jgi:tetratricopeptide (TPR) repeat protein